MLLAGSTRYLPFEQKSFKAPFPEKNRNPKSFRKKKHQRLPADFTANWANGAFFTTLDILDPLISDTLHCPTFERTARVTERDTSKLLRFYQAWEENSGPRKGVYEWNIKPEPIKRQTGNRTRPITLASLEIFHSTTPNERSNRHRHKNES